MPVVALPEDLSDQLNKSMTGTINNTQGPGVAVYWASDGSVSADIYVGLQLDGLKLYENISSVDPSIKMQFAIPPDVFCSPDDRLDFAPDKDKLISIKVKVVLKIQINYLELSTISVIFSIIIICVPALDEFC